MILAALLINGYRRRGRGERIRAEVALEINDDVLQRAAISGNHVFSGRGAADMLLGAIGLRSHVDVLRPRRRAVELDASGHGSGSGRIHRLAAGIRGGGPRFPMLASPFSTTPPSRCPGFRLRPEAQRFTPRG